MVNLHPESNFQTAIDYSYRILFEFAIDPETNERAILLLNIGARDEVDSERSVSKTDKVLNSSRRYRSRDDMYSLASQLNDRSEGLEFLGRRPLPSPFNANACIAFLIAIE
jgi:hypothetical protein